MRPVSGQDLSELPTNDVHIFTPKREGIWKTMWIEW